MTEFNELPHYNFSNFTFHPSLSFKISKGSTQHSFLQGVFKYLLQFLSSPLRILLVLILRICLNLLFKINQTYILVGKIVICVQVSFAILTVNSFSIYLFKFIQNICFTVFVSVVITARGKLTKLKTSYDICVKTSIACFVFFSLQSEIVNSFFN